jgi:hypothetical protein
MSMRRWFFKLLDEKDKLKDFACFYENPTITKDCSGSRIIISVAVFPLYHWSIFSSVHPSLDTGKICKMYIHALNL